MKRGDEKISQACLYIDIGKKILRKQNVMIIDHPPQ